MVGNTSAAILNMRPADVYGDLDGFRLEMAMLGEILAVMSGLGIAAAAIDQLGRAGSRLQVALVSSGPECRQIAQRSPLP